MDWRHDEYLLSDDKSRLDLEAVSALLAATYWARDRSRALIEKSIEHSVCFGLFRGPRQVGFARAVTDQATFSWVCDVVIHPEHRGHGLGRWMMQCLLDHPELQTVSCYLRTESAHGLYEGLGFQRVETLRRSTRPA